MDILWQKMIFGFAVKNDYLSNTINFDAVMDRVHTPSSVFSVKPRLG